MGTCPGRTETPVTDTVDALATDYQEARLRTFPTWAHMIGDYRFVDTFEEVSREVEDRQIQEARAFAERALLEALPLHADRLEGRAALARGDAPSAVEALARATEGFAALAASWETALARLWLGEAQLAASIPGARESAEAALGVFEELRSVREAEQARSLLSRSG